jgi:putative transposase
MVADPAGYPWSSSHYNALGVDSSLSTPHEEYLKLGETVAKRTQVYKSLFKAKLDSNQTTDIRTALNKGLATGTDKFKVQIEQLYGRRVKSGKVGRPKRI